ncbi:MAG: chromosome segregation protein SMC [Anaerolineales bacterium]|jgi:chromosome segregation protein
MPLRLKSLELHGYKTFAAKTNFEFAEGITAIVGPNGSGKSNIADALRWVFGEQSYSLLRAKKTEDMIFAGSEQRPRLGMASAGVAFDNTDGWLPVDFSEVALARRSYRDGRNEYLLNGQHVRLKDIHELLAQSGLSERTYTILGQGLVDASLALKADERRRLFEEAAGIGLYRSRREEALHRLEATRRNLDRVLDILAELEPRLKSLERQAARAQDYAQVQADLRGLLLEWYGFHWHRTQRAVTDILDQARKQEAKLAEARETYENMRQDLTTFRDHLNGLRTKLNSWHRQSAQLHESRESFSGNLAMLDERQRALLNNQQSVLSEQSQLSGEIKIAQEHLVDSESETVRLQKEYDEAQVQIRTAQTALDDRQAARSRLEADLQSIRHKIDEFSTRRAGLQARLDELASRTEGQKQKLEVLAQAIVSSEVDIKKTAQELKAAIAVRQKIETDVQKAEAELQLARDQQADLEMQLKEKQSLYFARQADKARFKAQLEVLDQAEQSFAGYTDGVKLLLDASRQLKLAGARGALSAALDVPAELEVAISAALGEYTDALLLESGQDAEQAMLLLDSDQSGRASLLPLDWLTPVEPLDMKKTADCLGVASDLVKTVAKFRPAVDLLLGHVLVVRDRATARRVLVGQPKNTMAVTLRGEVFHATGQVSAGRMAKVPVLGRPRQRRELQESLANNDHQFAKLESELQELSRQIESARNKVTDRQAIVGDDSTRLESSRNTERQAQVREESARRQLDWQVSQKASIESEMAQAEKDHEQAAAALLANAREEAQTQDALRSQSADLAAMNIDDYQNQVKFWSMSLAVAERALSDAQTRHVELTSAFDRMQLQQTTLDNRLMEIDKSLEELENERKNLRGQVSGINIQLEELRNLIEPAEKELETSETLEVDLQKLETEGQVALAHVERTNNQIQLELGRKQETLASLRQKIADDFGLVDFEYASDVSGPVPLPFDGMVEQLPAVNELPPDLEESMTRLRAQLRRMGAVNPEAKQEYRSVKERCSFLTVQMEDLHRAEADLHQVIAELDEITRHEFQKTFEAVAEQFHNIFHRLFGGGVARLVLTDPDDLTETGIDIEARLPGRREQGLSLLSGGERSLTAIALVFSLLKVSPTPVCVMDEVDAMLDETNVGRFRDLLLELSKETQFIIITHNRNTVQAANVIYGVTMGRDSASQVISLKLDEISEEYLK